MKNLIRLCGPIGMLFLATVCCCAQTGQRVKQTPHQLQWLAFIPGLALHVDGYELSETFDPATFERRDYIRAPKEKQPRQFYSHHRAIGVALVAACNTLFVEDGYTTKLTKLVAVDLANLKQTDVGSEAVKAYRHQMNAAPGIFINPRGVAVSPDCKRLLVAVDLTYDGATASEAEAESQRFPTRWYTVDVKSDIVDVIWKDSKAPQAWY